MKLELKSLTLEEKIGQMLMFAFHGTSYNSQLDEQIKEMHIGGVIHFARNVSSDPQEVKRLNSDIQKNSKYPVFIGVDQEGGMVVRVKDGISPFPGAMTISSTQKDCSNIYYDQGRELKELGYNIVFAPVADVNNNPHNPVIGSRSYSDDAKVVSKYVNMAQSGFGKANLLSTLKHFPGHGDTSVDSHLSLPKVSKDRKDLENVEFLPFKKAILNGCEGIMAAHIVYDSLDKDFPASLSKKIINDILRNEWGYQGLVITDSLTMGAIQSHYSYEEIIEKCVNASVDIMMFCGKADIIEQREIYETFLNLVKNGRIKEETIDKAVERIIRLKEKWFKENNDFFDVDKAYKNALDVFDNSVTIAFNSINPIINSCENVVIIFPEIKLMTLVDNDTKEYLSLGKYLPNCCEIIINERLENFDLVLEKTKKCDKIIMATLNVSENDYQTKVFNSLDKEKTIVVSLRSPFDNMYLEGIKNYICLYEVSKYSLNSLGKCLKGEIEYKGQLPIKLVRRTK